MREKKSKRILLAAICVASIMIIFCIVIECKRSDADLAAMATNIALSILCSLVASGIFCMMQSALSSDQAEAAIAKLEMIDEKLKQERQLYDSGIVSIRPKTYYDKEGEFWKTIINSTSDRLDLIGHTLSPWFDYEYRDIFIGKITSMLEKGKTIRIILSGKSPDMNKICDVENGIKEKQQLSKVELTCYEFRQIVKNNKESKRKRHRGELQVYVVDEQEVSYMYIRTDQQCFMSPYIASDNSFLLEMETGVEYSRRFDVGFENMLYSASDYKVEMGDQNERTAKNRGRKCLFRK